MGALGAVVVGVARRATSRRHRDPGRGRRRHRCGAFWGFIPGFLKAVSGAHEVVTTIMLNYIAIASSRGLVSGPLGCRARPRRSTYDVGNAALPDPHRPQRPPRDPDRARHGRRRPWLLYRTTLGFEIRTVGANPDAARYAGMRPRRLIVLTMSMCRAAGRPRRRDVAPRRRPTTMTSSFGTTVGFDAIAVALLARSSPIGILFAALLFGAMRPGAR